MDNLNNNQQQFKNLHQAFLGLQETRNLVENLKKKRNNVIDLLLTESTGNNMSDTQIRMLAAEAKGYRDIINYITTKHESIIGTK